MGGLRPISAYEVPMPRDATGRSVYATGLLAEADAMGETWFEVTENEHGEPFADLKEATLFAQCIRGVARRRARMGGTPYEVTRRGMQVFIRKEDKRQ